MTTTKQPDLAAVPAPPEPNKVPIRRESLYAIADIAAAAGDKQKANAIRSGCLGFAHGDFVPVSRALAKRWGLLEETE